MRLARAWPLLKQNALGVAWDVARVSPSRQAVFGLDARNRETLGAVWIWLFTASTALACGSGLNTEDHEPALDDAGTPNDEPSAGEPNSSPAEPGFPNAPGPSAMPSPDDPSPNDPEPGPGSDNPEPDPSTPASTDPAPSTAP